MWAALSSRAVWACILLGVVMPLLAAVEAQNSTAQYSIVFEFGGCMALNSQCCPSGCSFPGGLCNSYGSCGGVSGNYTTAGELVSGHCVYIYDPVTCEVSPREQGCQVNGVCFATYDCTCWVCNKICTGQPEPPPTNSGSSTSDSDGETDSESGSAGRSLPWLFFP
ncbi:hypothetical protein QOT17_019320 [Balamuthia mandrillaris]